MNTQDIIIDGKKLNKIQKTLFYLSSSFIKTSLLVIFWFFSFVIVFLIIQPKISSLSELLIINFIVFLIFYQYLVIVQSHVFITSRNNNKNGTAINVSWIVNKESFSTLIFTSHYIEASKNYNILLNSHGDEVFEKFKRLAVKTCPNMISHIDNLTLNDIQLYHDGYLGFDKKIIFNKTPSFDGLTNIELIDLYLLLSYSKKTDHFLINTLKHYTREELLIAINKHIIIEEQI